jgi:putative ABC transport system permease protein
MNLQLTLAWRYLSGRKLRTFLTTLAVVFGVLVLFGMNIILPTMIAAFEENVLGAAGVVDYSVTNLTGGSFPESVGDSLAAVGGVRALSPKLDRTVNLPPDFFDQDPAKADAISAVNLVGVIPDAARSVRSYVLADGRFLQDGDTASTVITQTLADAIGVKAGGTISLPTVNGVVNLIVVGILPPRTQPGNEEVLVNLPQAQLMTGEQGLINTIDVNIATGVSEARRAEISKNIETVLGSGYHVGTPLSGTDLFASLQLGQAFFNMLGMLALFMGGFIIFNTFRTVVAERRRDIGMLRALGATRNTILGTILAESLLQGVIGTALGLIFGYLLGAGIVKLAGPAMTSFLNIKLGNPVVTPGLIVVCVLMGVGVTALAGIIPARNASNVTPLEALRPSVAEVDLRPRLGAGTITGIVIIILTTLVLLSGNTSLSVPGGFLFLVGLVLVAPLLVRPFTNLFGKILGWVYARRGIGELAQGNLVRQPSRTAVTASATMLGLAVVVAAGGMISSLTGTLYDILHKSLGSDYLLIPPSVAVWTTDVGANAGLADRLRAVTGVADVSTLRFAGSKANGASVSLMGIDPVEFPKISGLIFSQGDESAYRELAGGRALIVNGAFLAAVKVKVGDTVELLTASGPQPYRVVAVASDLFNAKLTTAFISQANLQADFGTTEDVFLQLNLKPGADRAAADAQIKAIASDFPQFNIISGAAYFDSMKTLLQGVFAVTYFLFAFLAFPSLIAMLNTLAIGVIERTREIGMIRAVGATRAQIRNLVVAEALLLAAIGTVFGLAGGLYLGYTFVSAIHFIFPLNYAFPVGGMIGAVAFGLLFGALAAVIPARQASRLDIIAALHYE